MPRVLGVDPGTVTLDLCGLDDGRVFLDTVISTGGGMVDAALRVILDARPLDLVLGPSGYGLPLVPIEEVGEEELRLAFLPGAFGGGIEGLRTLLRRLAAEGLPVLLSPGVVHLPSVPPHRKANRIDMGTADKVCSAALAILDQATRLACAPYETSFILVELGGAFSAVLAVERGAIVDGLGGSSGPPGFLGSGAMDGEVACFLGEVAKWSVFSGGAAYVAGTPDDSPERLIVRTDAAAARARDYLVEGVVRAVAGELAIVPEAREILLAGRLTWMAAWRTLLERALAPVAAGRSIRYVTPIASRAKVAAQGAALLADGLAGGRYADIVDALRLRRASGSALDHLYIEGAAGRRRELLTWRTDTTRS